MDIKRELWLNEVQHLEPRVIQMVASREQLWPYYEQGKTPAEAVHALKEDLRRCPPHTAVNNGITEWVSKKSPDTGVWISVEHKTYTCKKCNKVLKLARAKFRELTAKEWEEFEKEWVVGNSNVYY